MRAYAVLSNVSSRLAAIPSILRQASGRRPAPRPPSGHQADAAPHLPDARLAKAPRPGAMSLPGWPWRTPWRRPRGLSRVMGGSIWRLLAAAGMALAAATASAVDVNSATAQQLESVSGIGPSTARTIVQERERAGAFESLDDLAERVRGIGPKKAKALQAAGLTVGGADGAAQNAAQGAATPAGKGGAPAGAAQSAKGGSAAKARQ